MNARLLFYGVVLACVLMLGTVVNMLIAGTPPPSPALTAADIEEFREALHKVQPVIVPNVTNANASPRSAYHGMTATG